MSQRRYKRERSLYDLVKPALKTSEQKRGFGSDAILRNWPQIVGEELAAMCVPQKISGQMQRRSLTVWCDPAFATQLHYQSEMILEKITTYVGYRAVDQLIIRQHVLPEKEPPLPPLPPLSAEQEAEITALTAQVEDAELKERLASVARLRQQLFHEQF